MKPLSLCALAIMLCMGTVAMVLGTSAIVPRSRHSNFQNVNDNTSQNGSAAFRDGFYAGRLAAERGSAPNVATGRWSNQGDRAMFITGYKRGYDEALAKRPAIVGRATKAE